jgi:hypothetical protein
VGDMMFHAEDQDDNDADCRNPTLREVWGRHSHSRKWDLGVLRDSQNFRVRS